MFGLSGAKINVSFLQEKARHLEVMQESQKNLLIQHQKLLEDLVHLIVSRNGVSGA